MTTSNEGRARRWDAGVVRPTERDLRVLRWLGEQFGAPLEVVAELYGVGPGTARHHAARLVRAQLVEREYGPLGKLWLVPTRRGLRFAGLGYERWSLVGWKGDHVAGAARLRLHLERLYPDAAWTSEREIRSRWANTGARVRFADGQLDLPDGRCVGVELELHRKQRHEYEGLIRDVDPAFDEVWWFCPPRDVTWLANVLDEIPRPERPRHLVLELPEGVAR
jgi:hypothetical protein